EDDSDDAWMMVCVKGCVWKRTNAVAPGGRRRQRRYLLKPPVMASRSDVLVRIMNIGYARLKDKILMNLPSTLLQSIDLGYIEDNYSGLSSQAFLHIWSSLRRNKGISFHESEDAKIWVPTNPRGAERLPPYIVTPEFDLYLRRLYGKPSEWNEFEWSNRATHVSVLKQTKWWYAKRFLHLDILATYDYIFIWDEDLGLEGFDAERYTSLVRKHGLEISQPALSAISGLTCQMTRKPDDTEVHK
nr:hypothetical protein CTI12_AA346980 [Tanacetum cinerariifolium]